MGVGKPTKPTIGVKVTVPVAVSTTQVPSPGTTKVSLKPSPLVSVPPTIFTEIGFKALSLESLDNIFIEIGFPIR